MGMQSKKDLSISDCLSSLAIMLEGRDEMCRGSSEAAGCGHSMAIDQQVLYRLLLHQRLYPQILVIL